MFRIKIPTGCEPEQHFALKVLMEDFLGLKFTTEVYKGEDILIYRNDSSKRLTFSSHFFRRASRKWLKPSSMPLLPLETWDTESDGWSFELIESVVPIIYGRPGILEGDNSCHCNLDIFGSAFFMLSRYEELVNLKRDSHGRFPATESVAYKEGFLDRPIINEYLEILWNLLSRTWSDLVRKKFAYQRFVTCDVDWPFDPKVSYFKYGIRSAAHSLIKKGQLIKSFKIVLQSSMRIFGYQVNDTYRKAIDWIMAVNEEVGNKVSFYFITHNTSKLDTFDDFGSLRIRSLFKTIVERGHEVGIHPGYNTFRNPENFKQTVKKFLGILQGEKITQKNIGGRQHYLRWDAAKTPQLWDKNLITYDSSLGYADRAGFRCGICYSFEMYDLVNREILKTKQIPLIVMENTIISSAYEDLGYSEDARQRFVNLSESCRRYNGLFTLLWHNTSLQSPESRKLYLDIIKL